MMSHLKAARLAATLAASGLLLSMSTVSHAQAFQGFSDINLRGDYGFAFNGTLLSGPAPLAATGHVYFDGFGVATSAVRTLDVGGNVFQQKASGTYTVNPDGTGSAHFHVVTEGGALPPSDESFAFVLDGHGDIVQFISTTPGVMAHGQLHKQVLGMN